MERLRQGKKNIFEIRHSLNFQIMVHRLGNQIIKSGLFCHQEILRQVRSNNNAIIDTDLRSKVVAPLFQEIMEVR